MQTFDLESVLRVCDHIIEEFIPGSVSSNSITNNEPEQHCRLPVSQASKSWAWKMGDRAEEQAIDNSTDQIESEEEDHNRH
jgi:hypothetical protein